MEPRLRAGVVAVLVFAAAVWLHGLRPAAAQAWPERTTRFILPVSAGTAADTAVRLVADRLTQSLGRSFIVDNMPGGRGLVAAQTAARAEPDGYTYFLGGVGVIAADRHINKSLPYDPDRDFTPVAMIYEAAAFVVAVHPDVPAHSVAELITLAKSQPGKLNYGTGTVGVLAIPGLWFNKLAGTELVAVPYNNSAQMLQDAATGRTQVLFTTIGAVEPFRSAGKLRVLGVSSIKRFPGLEQVPTIAEALPGYDIVGIGILMAPAGTPTAILQRLNREVDRIVTDGDFVHRLIGLGMTTSGAGTPQSLTAFMRAQRENWDRMLSNVPVPQ
jgi:tripartite-type tricarboxylate transporter receptor subunit TctC